MAPLADGDLQQAAASELLELAALLEGTSDDGWDAPSLCEGWRVREVVAHLTVPARYSAEQFGAELSALGGDADRLANELADRDQALGPVALVADLRSEAVLGWHPPGHRVGAVSHAVIHGLDVTVPLGAGRRPPDDTLECVLDDLASGGSHVSFGVELAGVRLEATDLDWAFGEGTTVRASAAGLVLWLCGRELEPGLTERAAAGR